MTTPILKTQRLTLAPPFLHENMSVDHHLRWLSNETVIRYSEQRHRKHTIESQREYLKSFTGDNQIWEIQRNTVPLGTITAYLNTPNKTANIGILIGEPRVWGQGYGPEAWTAVCDYLFEEGTRKIEAGCMNSNKAMVGLLRKCGFTYEAVLPSYFLLDGKPEDMRYYGKYREAKIIPIQGTSK